MSPLALKTKECRNMDIETIRRIATIRPRGVGLSRACAQSCIVDIAICAKDGDVGTRHQVGNVASIEPCQRCQVSGLGRCSASYSLAIVGDEHETNIISSSPCCFRSHDFQSSLIFVWESSCHCFKLWL